MTRLFWKAWADLCFWLRGCSRPHERQLLSAMWKPSPDTLQFLVTKFQHNRWLVLRGGIDGELIGFLPVEIRADGKSVYNFDAAVVDVEAIRGRANLSLDRLKVR